MSEENYKKRFDELASAVKEFLGTAATGTDEKGRGTYTDYHGVAIRIEKILGEISSNEHALEDTDKVIECDECGEEETISNSEYTKHSAEQDGWYFGITNARTICPKCNSINLRTVFIRASKFFFPQA